VVGNAVEKAFIPLVNQLNQVKNLNVDLCAFKSNYWGQNITVTGLLTGQDILTGLKNQDLGDGILLPSLMLKHNDTCFLDDMTVENLEKQLQSKIFIVTDIESLLKTCISIH
jgi:NifB/MoaA-like Fe-S oxidoreductase